MSHYPALIVLLLTLTSPPAPPAAQQTYEGTVHAVQAHPAGLELVTGVGFALRMIRVRTVPATVVDSAGAAIPMSHIAPGDIVRIDCSTTVTGLVADHVTKLGARGSRGGP